MSQTFGASGRDMRQSILPFNKKREYQLFFFHHVDFQDCNIFLFRDPSQKEWATQKVVVSPEPWYFYSDTAVLAEIEL